LVGPGPDRANRFNRANPAALVGCGWISKPSGGTLQRRGKSRYKILFADYSAKKYKYIYNYITEFILLLFKGKIGEKQGRVLKKRVCLLFL
jgi:hypothetical protein